MEGATVAGARRQKTWSIRVNPRAAPILVLCATWGSGIPPRTRKIGIANQENCMRSSTLRPSRFTIIARRAVALAVMPTLLAGCLSSSRSGGGSEAPTATARVENNLVPAVALTISLIPEQGERRTIGVVPAGETQELRFPVRGGTDPHRLLAEPTSGAGAGTVSRRFALANASGLQWNVGRNELNVSERR